MRVLISCTSPDVVVRTSRVPICDHSRHVIRYVILSTVSRVFSRRPRRRPCGTRAPSRGEGGGGGEGGGSGEGGGGARGRRRRGRGRRRGRRGRGREDTHAALSHALELLLFVSLP